MLSTSADNTLLDLHNFSDDSHPIIVIIKVLLLLSLDEGFIIIELFLYVYAKVNC